MPHMHQLAFTSLELKALWVRATGGKTDHDLMLDRAAERAIDKVYREEQGMTRKPARRAKKERPAYVALVTEDQPLVATPEPPPPVERLGVVPETCPKCERANGKVKHWGDSKGYGWHYYRRVPNAPALACGNCGAVVYVTEEVYDEIRAAARDGAPKATAGQVTRRMR